MNARNWKLAAALCLAASAVGCKQDSGHEPPPPGPALTITASPLSVVANGTNTVNVTVTDTGAVPVTLQTNKGTFPGGATSYLVPAGTGTTNATVALRTCNSATSATCAGVATVTASSSSGDKTTSVTFTSIASACQSSCSADAGCTGLACTLTGGGTGACASGVCAAPACVKNPANATTETSCLDGIDNDCNTTTDCADTTCEGQPCSSTSATSVCRSGACTDAASGLAITVSSDRQRLPANGSTTATVTVTVTSNGAPAPNMAVTVSTTLGTFGGATSATAATGANGTASFVLTAPNQPGVAEITAAPQALLALTSKVSITVPRLGAILVPDDFASPNPVMGVKSSGWNEFGGVKVQVVDDLGKPYPDGLVVHFEHRRLGGSTFAEPTVACAGAPATTCSAFDAAVSGATAEEVDKTGQASAPLLSGTLAGTLVVTATARAGGIGGTTDVRNVTLPGIAVVGAKANLANFSVQCSPRNVPALAESDCGTSWVESQITCAALMKDRYNNLLGRSTQVIFGSEAAAVSQVTWSPAYEPGSTGAEQPDLGTATQIFQTLGSGLPFDVDPQAGEPSVSHALDGCGTRTHNPRDGVVTIIAIADGEEAFFDANSNGVYDAATATDPGEPFIDQGEPFIDQNDNGAYDAGEWFLDVNANNAYDGPNGEWDAETKIWTQTVVVYTGYSAGEMVASAGPPATYLGTRWASTFTDACTATPAAAPFLVYAKVTGPPAIPPSSVGRVVIASDMNLNVLTSATTYAVKVEEPGKVKAAYHGLVSYADMLGLAYQYWPCDQPAIPANTACASQCRAFVPPTGGGTQTGPCLMKPAITDFSCGIAAGVTITGGDEADGTNTVDFTVDVPWDVYLGGKIMHDVVGTSGDNAARP